MSPRFGRFGGPFGRLKRAVADPTIFLDTFDVDLDGWTVRTGGGVLMWVADDSASHASGGQTGSLSFSTNGVGDNSISKSHAVPRNTLMRVDIVSSHLANGDRYSVGFRSGTGGFIAGVLIEGNSPSPFTIAQTVTFELTTPDSAAGETLEIRIDDFGTNLDTLFVDQVRGYLV